MKHKIFTIYDECAKAFLPPFVLHQTAMAVRAFSDAVNDPGSQFGKHPKDYTLFDIGVFDDLKGSIFSDHAAPVGNGLEYVKPFFEDERMNLSADQLVDGEDESPMGKQVVLDTEGNVRISS